MGGDPRLFQLCGVFCSSVSESWEITESSQEAVLSRGHMASSCAMWKVTENRKKHVRTVRRALGD